MSKKILITGSGGLVGSYTYALLKEQGYTVLGIGKTQKDCVDIVCDISDADALTGILNHYVPDQVIHLAALSYVEKCEQEHDMADAHNIVPTRVLVEWCRAHDARMIFASTDYVYDGTTGNFDEQDEPRPLQYYGETKLRGEQMVASLTKYVIARPTVIYGWDEDGMNFFMQLYRNVKEGRRMNVPVDQISNPTSVIDFAHVLQKIVEQEDVSGTFVTTGSESFSRYAFAQKIARAMSWSTDILQPVETKDLGQVAVRPLNNSTNNALVCDTFGVSFRSLEENLQDIKQLMNI